LEERGEGRGGEKRVEGVRPYGGIEMCLLLLFLFQVYTPKEVKIPGVKN